MKRAALFGLGALAAAGMALAQQSTPPQDPQTSPAPQEQAAPPADSSQRSMSEADKQTLLKDCMKQVQAANPNVDAKDIKAYCDKQVQNYSPQ